MREPLPSILCKIRTQEVSRLPLPSHAFIIAAVMNAKFSFVFVTAILGVCFFQDAQQDSLATTNSELAQRVDKLEQRVALLEKILFSSAKLSTMQAQRQLEEAKSRLKNSQALQARGMITELQLRQDKFRLEEAEKSLELSIAETRQNELVGELEVLEAEQRLRQAKQQLQYSEKLASRGFATQTQVEGDRRLVDIAQQTLTNARTKLGAAKQLEAIKDK